ncbi:hypothetical protein [Clostridium sp. JN-1]|uniref:hypothetical protein n=1 Tax=Clostridium sp. JN-1 TaxID=2483110 RepID=UPI000F0B208C|nr:hypothetical protein [Clostridium sp. JN-1]
MSNDEECCICGTGVITLGSVVDPKNKYICGECNKKGYDVCKIDNKVFNKKFNQNFKLNNKEIYKLEGNLEILNNEIKINNSLKYKVCSERCFNRLYLKKYIEELKSYLGQMLQGVDYNIFNNNLQNENIKLIKYKINELEIYKSQINK